MADYLTLLARRSLGAARPVEPARAHRYAASGPPAERVVVGSTVDGVRATRQTVQTHARPRGEAAPSTTTTDSGQTRPSVPKDDGTAPVTHSVPYVPPVSVRREIRARPRRTEGETAGNHWVESAIAAEAGVGELLVPNHASRGVVERAPVSAPESVSPAAEARDDRGGDRRSARASDESIGRMDGPPEQPLVGDPVDHRPGGGSVEVSIGTIEIRAVPPSPPAAIPRPRGTSPRLGLDDYLAQRGRGER